MPCGSTYAHLLSCTETRLYCFRRRRPLGRSQGEFLSAIGAEPVYKLFGYGLGATEQPLVNEPVHGRIGYHIQKWKA